MNFVKKSTILILFAGLCSANITHTDEVGSGILGGALTGGVIGGLAGGGRGAAIGLGVGALAGGLTGAAVRESRGGVYYDDGYYYLRNGRRVVVDYDEDDYPFYYDGYGRRRYVRVIKKTYPRRYGRRRVYYY